MPLSRRAFLLQFGQLADTSRALDGSGKLTHDQESA